MYNVLIVEDDKDSAYLLTGLLRHINGSVVISVVGTLKGALALLGLRQFDLCVLDLHLRDSEPAETAEAIRIATAPVPVVCYTSSPETAEGLGFRAVLPKDSGQEEVRAAIKSALEERLSNDHRRLLEKADAFLGEALNGLAGHRRAIDTLS